MHSIYLACRQKSDVVRACECVSARWPFPLLSILRVHPSVGRRPSILNIIHGMDFPTVHSLFDFSSSLFSLAFVFLVNTDFIFWPTPREERFTLFAKKLFLAFILTVDRSAKRLLPASAPRFCCFYRPRLRRPVYNSLLGEKK